MSAKPFVGKRIGVLRGGQSSEREVSLRSGAAVAAALKRQGYEVLELEPDRALLERLLGIPRHGDSPRDSPRDSIDVAFIALHGRGGEDGQIQGLLEWLAVPYTGSGLLASALGMNKALTKQLLLADGIPTPRYQRHQLRQHEASTAARHRPSAPVHVDQFPVVVKPTCEGSTVGVSIVSEERALAAAVELAGRYGGDVLIEDYIDGHELTVAILDDEPLPPIEIVPRKAFYTYEAKYTPGQCDYRLPPVDVPAAVCRRAQELAVRVHRLLECSGATRVDFRVDRSGAPFVLEINTVPGMTETSLLPKAAAAAGFDYETLVVRILASACGRVNEKTGSIGGCR